jgi:hypothetical protein
MAFTEFYCRTTGSNLNAGTSESTTSRLTYSAGSWVAATGVFTVASGNPSTDGVVVGEFASVYATGAVVTGFVGRVTAVDATTITVSLTAKSGTAPVDGTGTRVCKVGGSWKGPNAGEDFPFGFVLSTMNNGVNLVPRINFKSGNYSITGTISHFPTDVEPVVWSGYQTTPGDNPLTFAVPVLLGPTSGASFVTLTLGSTGCRRQWIENFAFKNNGLTGTSTCVVLSSALGGGRNLRIDGCCGIGFNITSAGGTYFELDVNDANQSLTANTPAILVGGTNRVVRSRAQYNGGHGFGTGTGASVNVTLQGCISAFNPEAGYSFRLPGGTAGGSLTMLNCDAYANADGVQLDGVTLGGWLYMENCNFIAATDWGIQQVDALFQFVMMRNCGFGFHDGSSAFTNESGDVSVSTGRVIEKGRVTYPIHQSPWLRPSFGEDFRIAHPMARGGGDGGFPSNTGFRLDTVGYPDIGAAHNIGTILFTPRPNPLLRR